MATVVDRRIGGTTLGGDAPVGDPGLAGITWHPMIATTLDAQLAALTARHRDGLVSGADVRAGRRVAIQRRLLTNRMM